MICRIMVAVGSVYGWLLGIATVVPAQVGAGESTPPVGVQRIWRSLIAAWLVEAAREECRGFDRFESGLSVKKSQTRRLWGRIPLARIWESRVQDHRRAPIFSAGAFQCPR
ncbi:hypothetical protein FA13DRAFT_170657 [Coprinellus micaceus]|uniref:Secreted protein n=1 Tax=Coprinellus micaceus TaxID=71717 RepID=A0A4Y7SGZ2_COPMI|nr:hypothetical protein FA13DRAFT_170657 [Coprinellus micaceus]